MNFSSHILDDNKNYLNQLRSSLPLRKSKKDCKEIQQEMSPKEIAEVVSNHLIRVVKEQFEVAKKEYHSRERK